jgi:hypothetical protein
MAPVCGKPLSPEDRKVWQQAIASLVGLKVRNGFGEKELTAEVGTALHRAAASRNCEDCGVKVTSGAAHSVAQGTHPLFWRAHVLEFLRGLSLGRAIHKPGRCPICTQSPASHLNFTQ